MARFKLRSFLQRFGNRAGSFVLIVSLSIIGRRSNIFVEAYESAGWQA